jgi:hypothetical protein
MTTETHIRTNLYPFYAIRDTQFMPKVDAIRVIMQNKPNFLSASMNINPFMTKYYKQKPPIRSAPKQTQSKPIKPNLRSIIIRIQHNCTTKKLWKA